MADEYIKRRDVLIKLEIAYDMARTDQKLPISDLQHEVNLIKAADVQPTRHGRWLHHHAIWIDQPKIEGWFVQAQCSECEKWAHVMDPYTKSVDYECCPHCGARMDLKDGEQND